MSENNENMNVEMFNRIQKSMVYIADSSTANGLYIKSLEDSVTKGWKILAIASAINFVGLIAIIAKLLGAY